MGIDFSDMLDEDDEAVLHPRDIFFTLDRQPNFSFPRDIQTEVMNHWFDTGMVPEVYGITDNRCHMMFAVGYN
jgi:hypothetical protein